MGKIIDHILQKKFFYLQSSGTSMLPLLRPKDIVYYKKSLGKIRVNDLVLIKKNGILLTHRVIYASKKYVITAGDNNNHYDGKTKVSEIKGKVYQIIRNGQVLNPERLYLLQSLLYFREITKIISIFNRKKINFVLLKGLPLHLYVEKEHPRRIYADCDILIDPNHNTKAHKALKKAGYDPDKSPRYSLFQKFIGTDVKEKSYIKTVKKIPVIFDIHYQVTFATHKVPNPFQNIERAAEKLSSDILSNKKFINISGQIFPVVDDENLIFYLMLHFFTHLFSQTYRLDFIYKVCRRKKNVDWTEILNKIHSYQMINFVVPTLYLLNKYYDMDEPYRIAKKLYPKNVSYSLMIYKILGLEREFFTNSFSFFRQRTTRALLIFFYAQENILTKILTLFNPRLILHFIYFLILRIRNFKEE